ncbi:ribonuclease H-like domain-containing protein [bacterium]|nr:ribonuclease H-like domain-containing protein [bacterium]
MYIVDDKYYNKKEALKRCNEFMKSSVVFFSDGSFVKGKEKGGYGFVSVGSIYVEKSGVDVAKSPVEMELKAIKHTLAYLNMNREKLNDLDIVIFNDCLNAIGKIKKYVENPTGANKLLDEIHFLLTSLSDKTISICWVKKESLKYHEKVDSLSKMARDMVR